MKDPSTQRPTSSDGPDTFLDQKLFMENIIQAMSDGVAVVDRRGSIILVNQALCQMLGYAREQLLKKGWAELFFSKSENLDFNQTIVEVIQTHQPIQNREVAYLRPDGDERALLATVSLIQDQGKTRGLVALFKDITELTRLHSRERRLMMRTRRLYEEMRESLDRVARAVAHEVRNPVTAIGGLASRLLKNVPPQSKEAQYLKRILESTTRLELIVSQVQLYAYLPQPYRRPLAMKQWLTDILDQYQDLARRQGVRISLEGADDDLVVQLDPELMASALNNLIINAIEAMPQGGDLSVTVEANQEELHITITDTGVGISPRDLPYLWDPFFTTKADRVGMSLAITKRIISEHNGTLEVESAPGKGTRIMICLPRTEEADTSNHRQPQLK